MTLNDAADIYFMNQQVKKIAVGNNVIWQKDVYLKVTPDKIWLMKSNDYQADVQILSNVKWDVKKSLIKTQKLWRQNQVG